MLSIVARLRAGGNLILDEDLACISPLMRKHVTPNGSFISNPREAKRPKYLNRTSLDPAISGVTLHPILYHAFSHAWAFCPLEAPWREIGRPRSCAGTSIFAKTLDEGDVGTDTPILTLGPAQLAPALVNSPQPVAPQIKRVVVQAQPPHRCGAPRSPMHTAPLGRQKRRR